MTDFELGPLGKRRRGVPIGTFLIWIIISGASSAAAWDVYGDDVLTKLGLAGRKETPEVSDSSTSKAADDDRVAAVRELQASQKRMADELETALVLLNAQQPQSKTILDSLAVLAAKVDALQHPTAVATKMPAAISSRKPPLARRAPGSPAPEPASASPPDQ